jgi:hypothetical protein
MTLQFEKTKINKGTPPFVTADEDNSFPCKVLKRLGRYLSLVVRPLSREVKQRIRRWLISDNLVKTR